MIILNQIRQIAQWIVDTGPVLATAIGVLISLVLLLAGGLLKLRSLYAQRNQMARAIEEVELEGGTAKEVKTKMVDAGISALNNFITKTYPPKQEDKRSKP